MGCPQIDSVERERYAGAPSIGSPDDRERNGASDLMERIQDRDKLNPAYKQVKRNHADDYRCLCDYYSCYMVCF